MLFCPIFTQLLYAPTLSSCTPPSPSPPESPGIVHRFEVAEHHTFPALLTEVLRQRHGSVAGDHPTRCRRTGVRLVRLGP